MQNIPSWSYNPIEVGLSEMAKTVIFKQFSQWHKGKIIAGVRMTAGSNQFAFYVGNDDTVVDTIDDAKTWKPYQRTTAIAKNTELENELKTKFKQEVTK